jgi:nitrite reductase/ring-hydroxylating ferredoxin subunit
MPEYVVGTVDELKPGERKIVKIKGMRIGVFRIGDDYFAVRDICPHQYGPVCGGNLGPALVAGEDTGWQPVFAFEGEVLCCPWHGLEFHIPTGRCLAFPEMRLRRYPVKVENGALKVIL